MRKADELRDWLLRSVPGLKDDPGRLHSYVHNGRPDFRRGDTLSYGYRYDLEICIWDYSHSFDQLMVPLIIWLAANQPDLIDQAENGLRFETDTIDNERSDVSFTLPMRETVVVSANPNEPGGYLATREAASPSINDVLGLGDGAKLSRIWLDEFDDSMRRWSVPDEEAE